MTDVFEGEMTQKVSFSVQHGYIICYIVSRKYHSLYASSRGVAEANGPSSEEHRQHRARESVRVCDQIVEARHRLRRFSLSLKGLLIANE